MKIQNRHIPVLLFALFFVAAAGLFFARNGAVLFAGDPVVMIGPGSGSDEGAGSSAGYSEPRFPINVNEAPPEELEFLPGIGAATASAIAEYRRENGPFSRAEDLMAVPGIGAAKLQEILPYLTLGG